MAQTPLDAIILDSAELPERRALDVAGGKLIALSKNRWDAIVKKAEK